MRPIHLAVLTLLLIYSAWITEATRQEPYSKHVLRQKLLSYLMDAKRESLLDQQREQLETEFYRREQSSADEDEDNYEISNTRRKAVGLGDNPFK